MLEVNLFRVYYYNLRYLALYFAKGYLNPFANTYANIITIFPKVYLLKIESSLFIKSRIIRKIFNISSKIDET